MNPDDRRALLLSQQQRDALRHLLTSDAYDDRPCRDTLAWDLPPKPPGLGAPAARRYMAQQVEDRKAKCGTCPVLAACEAYVQTGAKIDGVTAGHLLEVRT